LEASLSVPLNFLLGKLRIMGSGSNLTACLFWSFRHVEVLATCTIYLILICSFAAKLINYLVPGKSVLHTRPTGHTYCYVNYSQPSLTSKIVLSGLFSLNKFLVGNSGSVKNITCS
jgi:hypothetical protein